MSCRVPFAAVFLSVFAGACATQAVSETGPVAAIPVFAADDARVGAAGFVGETLRLSEEHDGVRYTLMAFVVGDRLTLGAMVKGSFRGTVRWTVGRRTLALPFDSAAPGAEVDVVATGAGDARLVAQGAAFRGTAWSNVELPTAEWIAAGTPLALAFERAVGGAVILPDPGHHYVVNLEPR